jgi:hypothetical protein
MFELKASRPEIWTPSGNGAAEPCDIKTNVRPRAKEGPGRTRIGAKQIFVTRSIAALFRTCGGATLLLALWLSIVPGAHASPAKPTQSFDLRVGQLVDLLVAEEVPLAEEATQAPDKKSGGGGSADAGLQAAVADRGLLSSRLAGVPEATGPPAASPDVHYQARAPPLA